MARPPKLTPELQQKIVKAIQAGAYVETAAAFAGIHKDTFYDWMRRGARNAGRDKPYREFSDAVQKAMAEAEVKDIHTIDVAAKKDWKAAAWKLERRHPERWRRRTDAILHHEGPSSETDGGPVQIVAAVHDPAGASEQEVARAAHDFLRIAGRPPAPPVDT